MKLFFTDIESTGFNHNTQCIVQIGGLITENFKQLAEMDIKCQPDNWDTISADALKVNHTTIDILKTYQSPQEAWNEYSKLLLKHFNGVKYVFVAQNAPFDKRFMRAWWNKYKTDDVEEFDYYFEEANLDLMHLSKAFQKHGFLELKNLKLGTVIEAHDIKVDGELHDAVVDIKATGNCIYKSLKLVESIERDQPDHEIVSQFRKWKVLIS